MKPPARIRLRLLGRLAVAYGDDPAPVRLSTRKAGALIAYLAMSPEQTASREELATLLWGSCSDQQARQSLRQALALLRKELRWAHFLTADTAVVRLQPGLWSVDARDFETLSKSSEADGLARAARLFGGEFLSGLNIEEEGFEEWLRGQRQRTQLAATRLCETFAARPALVRDGEQAVAAVERLLALDPLREDWQRIALTLYARYRGKSEALAQAEAFAALLQRELGVAPEQETRALIERIRDGDLALAAAGPQPIKPEIVVPVSAPCVEPALLEIAGEPALEQRRNAQIEQTLALPSPVPRPRSSTRRGVIGALALGCLIVAAGIFGLTYSGSVAVNGGDPTAQAPALVPPPDSWQSPTNGLQNAAIEARANERVIPMVVVPFASDEGASSNLSDQITDGLINTLSRLYRLRVISRNTSQQYKGKPTDAAVLGTELGVRYVLEGSVRARGDRLRVNVELIDTATRLAVWSDQIEYAQADHNAVADEIVIRIGRALQVETRVLEVRRAGERPSAVYQLVDKGWVTMFGGPSTLDRLNAGKAVFEQALRQDPNSLAAQTGLAAYHVEVVSEVLVNDPAPHIAESLKLLHAVVAGDPYAATAYYFLARAQRNANDFNAALRSFARAIELNPSYTSAHAQVGLTLMFLRRPADALAHILYAIRLSPKDQGLPYWLRFAAEAELTLGHDAQAVQYLERSLEIAPKQLRAWGALAAVQALSGNTAAARKAIAKVRELGGGSSDAELLQRLGRLDRLGPNRVHEGLQIALALGSETDPWQSPRSPSQAAPASPVSAGRLIPVLILPFKAYGESEGSIQLLADMMTDDLTNMLSRIRAFRVISRQTARSYRGQSIDVAAVGADLQVRYILDGSMRMHGEKLRVNVELIDPTTKLSVWTGQIERDGADRSGVQDEIIARLARELNVEMPQIESEKRAADRDAVALSYRGWAAMNAAYSKSSAQAFRQAETFFTQALERDPQNIGAMVGLAAYHANMGAQVLDGESRAHRDKAREMLRAIVEKAPQHAAAHHFLGLVGGVGDTPEDALKAFARSVELNPSNAGGHAHIGHALTRMGRPSEGIEHVRYAIRLSPRDPNLGYWVEFLGSAELRLSHYRAAIENFRRSTELNPGYPRGWAGLAAAQALSGDMDEARRNADKLRTFAPQLSAEALAERFSRRKEQPLYEGLRLALAVPADAGRPPPSKRRDADANKPVRPISAIAAPSE